MSSQSPSPTPGNGRLATVGGEPTYLKDAPPPPQISWLRVTVLIAIIACVAAGAWKLISDSDADGKGKQTPQSVYAPYVDVTLTPTYPFESPTANPVASVYLGFIVAGRNEPCTPTWGTYYTLIQAAQALDLDSRIAQVEAQGGSAAISFGGELNNELASGCTNVGKLTSAYESVIARYKVNTIDFDIEGTNLADTAADARRAAAVAALQKHDPKLKVWMTLPVADTGLTSAGTAAVKAMLSAHVKLAGVNVMAMDFGAGEGASKNLLKTVEASLFASHAQVQTLWGQAKLDDSSTAAWEHLGVTVMIGVNDIESEHFTIADAHGLEQFVTKQGIGRVSIWSLNRDSECGSAFATTGVVSNTCSGVLQQSLQFTKIFGSLPGTKTANVRTATTPAIEIPTTTTSTSGTKNGQTGGTPYPLWRSTAQYTAGYKVVWEGSIYQAQYWTQGTAPGSGTGASPWLLIGPVTTAGSYKPVLLAQGRGTFPAWSPSTVYHAGARVSDDGLPYIARWYTQGDQPNSELPSDPTLPWEPLFKAPGEPSDNGTGS